MCEVLRALVKCGGLFFMSTNFIRPLIWEVTRLGTANTKVWYFLYYTLVSLAPRFGTANAKGRYSLCHTLVSLVLRFGAVDTMRKKPEKDRGFLPFICGLHESWKESL